MKYFKLMSIVSIILLVSSCSVNKKIERSLIAKWNITTLKTSQDENLSDNYKTIFENMLSNSYIEFKDDKSFDLKIFDKTVSDSWSISEDGKKILSSKSDNYFNIINISENTMVLESVKSEKKVTIKLTKI